jgi:lipid A ethanolaminephosphotransferase
MTERRFFRPQLTAEFALWLCCLFFAVFCNQAYWSALLDGRQAHWKDMVFVLVHGAGLSALFFLVLAVLTPRSWLKPVMTLFFLVTAAAVYYIERYHVYLDSSMVRNVLQTDPKEAGELITIGLLGKMTLYGGIPAALLWLVRLQPAASTAKAIARRLLHLVVAVSIFASSLLIYFADLSSFHRNHREARFLLTPANYVYSLARVVSAGGAMVNAAKIPIGTDASARQPWSSAAKPPLVVLVLGETARAANFQLNGYARPTNPKLSTLDIVNYPNVQSCGTATATSLPCMFSHFGRKAFSDDEGSRFESVLHVLARAGMRVIWRDNQSGCKGVCDGLEVQDVSALKVAPYCEQGRCYDEILLHDFDSLTSSNKPTVVVMHQLGSHGPSYFARYPKHFAKFAPECKEADLRLCNKEAITNAYDNTIVYTDHLLASIIERLRTEKNFATALIYVSDHGESLGENGLFLHGLPYAIAPLVQKHVPMVMWMSQDFRTSAGIDQNCLKARASGSFSHDNLFHSLLGLLAIDTKVYDGGLDIFKPCTRAITPP